MCCSQHFFFKFQYISYRVYYKPVNTLIRFFLLICAMCTSDSCSLKTLLKVSQNFLKMYDLLYKYLFLYFILKRHRYVLYDIQYVFFLLSIVLYPLSCIQFRITYYMKLSITEMHCSVFILFTQSIVVLYFQRKYVR